MPFYTGFYGFRAILARVGGPGPKNKFLEGVPKVSPELILELGMATFSAQSAQEWFRVLLGGLNTPTRV